MDELPVYRGDRPSTDGGAVVTDGGVTNDDAGPSGECVPEVSGARFGVCGGRFTTIGSAAQGARFGVSGTIERAAAKASGGRFGVTGGEIHVR